MFDYKHYVPILRWKAAEKEALGGLTSDQKKLLTPLIELIMPQPAEYKVKEDGVERIKNPEELLDESIAKMKIKIPEFPEEILKYWGESPVFIDLSKVDFSLRTDGFNKILLQGEVLKLFLIPVISLASETEVKSVAAVYAKKSQHGIALRLFRSDFDSNLTQKMTDFFKQYNLSKQEIDLIVDFQITDSNCLAIQDYISQLHNIMEWRTFAVISGTFPKNLMNFSIDRHSINRKDWQCWLAQVTSGELSRKPSFGDYTIQHPIYSEPAPGLNPSASIRYTTLDNWVIMRGQGLRSPNSAGYAQYPALAHLLLEQPEFFGKDFSEGDAYIDKIGSDVSNKLTGNPRTWLRAGINHHLVCTISQLSSLS